MFNINHYYRVEAMGSDKFVTHATDNIYIFIYNELCQKRSSKTFQSSKSSYSACYKC